MPRVVSSLINSEEWIFSLLFFNWGVSKFGTELGRNGFCCISVYEDFLLLLQIRVFYGEF